MVSYRERKRLPPAESRPVVEKVVNAEATASPPPEAEPVFPEGTPWHKVLQELRTRSCLMSSEAAELLETSQGTFSKWENGIMTPSPDKMRLIISIFPAVQPFVPEELLRDPPPRAPRRARARPVKAVSPPEPPAPAAPAAGVRVWFRLVRELQATGALPTVMHLLELARSESLDIAALEELLQEFHG